MYISRINEISKLYMYIDKFLLILVFGEVCIMLWYDHVFDRGVRSDLVLLFNIVKLVVGENNRVAKAEEDDDDDRAPSSIVCKAACSRWTMAGLCK